MLEEKYRSLCCEFLRQFYDKGWVTGTGGGMAIQNPISKNIVMSPSGVQKERLKPHNVFVLNQNGKIIENGIISASDTVGSFTKNLKLSACFKLFMSCFDIYPLRTGCVIHSHSKNISLISMMFDQYIEISGLEMIKGITGHSNTDRCIIPIIQNTEKEPKLVNSLQNALKNYPKSYAVVVRGHGMYCFGETWQKAKQHAECYDYLFSVVAKMKQLNIGENILYKTNYFNSFPVNTIGDNNSVSDTINYLDHPEYSLFLVNDHPFNNNLDDAIPMIRSLIWDDKTETVLLLNQRIIPQKFGTVRCRNYIEMSKSIKNMTIRGAPAIGVSGAYGMALAAIEFNKNNKNPIMKQFIEFMQNAKNILDSSRPTAVNLVWATSRMMDVMNECILLTSNIKYICNILLCEAHEIANEDININVKLGEYGNSLICNNYCIMHHCNTGSLATVCGGTALGIITKSFYSNKNINVYVNETRPRLQGSRLTSWELSRMNIPHKIVVDGCCAHLLSSNRVDCIIVGCDRVAINGDTANKIGTHSVAVCAYQYGIPMYIACPVSTIDYKCKNGSNIVIEERNINEIKEIGGINIANRDGDCYNPAFDITPHKFITAFITEYGICYPPFNKSLMEMVNKQKNDVANKRKKTFNKYKMEIKQNIEIRSRL